MNSFAPESYYQEFTAKVISLGYRLVAKLEITTDDMPYHVEVDKARVTCFTFDVPDKAFFVNFYHHEHTGFFGEGYANHWCLRIDVDIAPMEYDDDEDYVSLHDIYVTISADMEHVQAGWSSQDDTRFTFTGDVEKKERDELTDVDLLGDIFKQMLVQFVPYTGTKFEKLMVMWSPTYTFTGPQDYRVVREEREQKLNNIYWDRFGEGRKILRQKITRII